MDKVFYYYSEDGLYLINNPTSIVVKDIDIEHPEDKLLTNTLIDMMINQKDYFIDKQVIKVEITGFNQEKFIMNLILKDDNNAVSVKRDIANWLMLPEKECFLDDVFELFGKYLLKGSSIGCR